VAAFLALAAPARAADADEWDQRYAQARRELLNGQFAACAPLFATLVTAAPDQGRRERAAEAASLCQTWSSGGFRLVLPAQAAELERDDRRTLDELAVLYTTAVLYGIGSGVVLATWTEPASPAGAILPALALAGASVGAVAALDHFELFRYGVPQSAVSGLLIGLEEGIAWTLWNQSRVTFDDEWDGNTVAAIWWAGATAGALAGGSLGWVYGTTPGRSALMGSGALWTGLVLGLTGAVATGQEDHRDDNGWLAAAVGVNVGALGGAYLAAQFHPSIARVRFIDLGALAGGLTVGGVAWAVGGRDAEPRPILTAAALGVAGGVAAAWWLTRGMQPDPGRAPRGVALAPLLAPTRGGALVGVAGGF
jgi:hypothetical protein